MAAQTGHSVAVWDLPLRLCHWGFAALIPALWWTAENSQWAWHKRCGLFLLALVLFRIVWGFIGTRTARFASFLRGPAALVAYLKGARTPASIGHNPLGALSVVALLGAMLAQTMLGLFAGDPYDGATGPLNGLVSVMTADLFTDWHESFFDVILVMASLHLAAIAFYAIAKRWNLVSPMVSGRSTLATEADGIGPVPWGKAALAAGMCAALVGWIANRAPPFG